MRLCPSAGGGRSDSGGQCRRRWQLRMRRRWRAQQNLSPLVRFQESPPGVCASPARAVEPLCDRPWGITGHRMPQLRALPDQLESGGLNRGSRWAGAILWIPHPMPARSERYRRRCADCGGGSFCEHKRHRTQCVDCRGRPRGQETPET